MSISILALKAVRRLIRVLETWIERRTKPYLGALPIIPEGKADEYRRFFDELVASGQTDASYMATHRERLVRTMCFVPPPRRLGSVLELGSYMQMAPALHLITGYPEVRAAYHGPAGGKDLRQILIGNSQKWQCEVDLFDAERDRFPYADGALDLVICCEMIEHLLHDPIHMLWEIHRVLDEGGLLLLTTPNCVSYTSVARALKGDTNPQMYAAYDSKPDAGTPHVREYTPAEMEMLMKAAGFQIVNLFTDPIEKYAGSQWTHRFLEENGFDPSLRGEQMYCLARKTPGIPRERRPVFLYD